MADILSKNMPKSVLINSLRIAGRTKIFMPFLSLSDNLLQIITLFFKKSFDNFEVTHKTWSIFGLVFSSLFSSGNAFFYISVQ